MNVARAIALSMADPDARRTVFRAFASSGGPERKIHLNSFVSGRGRRMLDASELRGGPTRAELVQALNEGRDFELYMPVQGHRGKWTAEEEPLVAVQLDESDPIVAYDSRGSSRTLPRSRPPIQPVVAIVPVEAPVGSPTGVSIDGHSGTSCEGLTGETLERAWKRCHDRSSSSLPLQSVVAALDGLYLKYLELYQDEDEWEPWIRGNPEFEIHVRQPSAAGQTNGGSRQCSAQYPAVSGQPGDGSSQYAWDMNGTAWAGTVKLLSGPQLDAALAAGGYSLEMWEDDLDACELKPAGAELNSLLAIYAGVIVISVGWALNPSPANIDNIVYGAILIISGIVGLFSSGDDIVGVIAAPQGGFVATAGTNSVIVTDQAMVGRALLQIHDATPPVPGPTASVQVVSPPLGITAVGSMSRFTALARDASGIGAPERPVTWSSSNSSIATVDEYGWVSGLSAGDLVITANVDGISSSVGISILPPGPPATLELVPYQVTLTAGQQGTLTVRAFDVNGFELTVNSGSVQWSSDSGACSVDGGGVVTGNGSPYWASVSAMLGGVSASAGCSVDGGGEYSRAGRRSTSGSKR